MPELSHGPAVSGGELTAQIQATALAMRHELDLGARALMGLSCPTGIFSGLEGLAEERARQLETFRRGEAMAASGSGMDRRNLEVLEGLSGTLRRYGITVEVDFEAGSFALTNNNYIPLGLIPAEDRLALVTASNFASKCLEQADVLASQGRLDEAGSYLRWAGALQARYSEYVEGARVLEALASEREGFVSLPPVGVSESSARDALSGIAGHEISAQDFPAEFERRMGVGWEEFRESGFASLALRSFDSGMQQMAGGLSSLAARMQEMCGASEREIAGAETAAFLPPEGYADAVASARDGADFAFSLRNDVYIINGIRDVANGLRGAGFEGAPLYQSELRRERDGIVRMYAQAEGSIAESIFLRAAAPEGGEEAERNYASSRAERVRGADFLANAEEMVPGLSERYASLSRYGRIQEELVAQDFGRVRDSVSREQLIYERDALVYEISDAAREGREMEGLDGRVASLGRRYEYMQLREFWSSYEFEGVRGGAGVFRLNGDREAILGLLEGGLESGAEIPDLERRQEELLALHERCAAYEKLLAGAYESQMGRMREVSTQFDGARDGLRHGIGELPEELRGVALASVNPESGNAEWQEVSENYSPRKRGLNERIFVLGDEFYGGYRELREGLESWYEDAMWYRPADLEAEDVGRENPDLFLRFSFDTNPGMERIRRIHGDFEGLAARASEKMDGVTGEFNAIVAEFNSTANFLNQQAQLYRLDQQFDTIAAAATVAFAVWNIPKVVAAGRSVLATGRNAMAAIENFSPILATGVRGSLTVASLGMSTYGGFEFAEGVQMMRAAGSAEERVAAAEQMFEGALYIGSLGVASRLPGGILRVARTVSVGLDAGAIATIAPSVAAVSYSMYERGDVSGWDIAETTLWTGLGIAGAYFGIRVPGGVRVAVREGAEVAAKATPMSVEQFAEMVRNAPPPRGMFAAEGAGFVRVAELPAPVGPVQRQAMEADAQATLVAARQAEDARAIEALSTDFERMRAAFRRGGAIQMTPELRRMEGIMSGNPGWTAEQAATEYVLSVRAAGLPLPPRLVAEPGAMPAMGSAEVFRAETRAVESPAVAAAEAERALVAPGPPISEADFAASLERIGDPARRQYIAEQFRAGRPDRATMDNVLAIFGDRSGARAGVHGSFGGVSGLESIGMNAGANRLAVNGCFDEGGRILAFGVHQHIPPEILERSAGSFHITVDIRTGRIDEIYGENLPASITSLRGMQYEGGLRPGAAAEVQVGGAPTMLAPSPVVGVISAPPEVVERFSTTFSIDEIHAMWTSLENRGYVVPRAGYETTATEMYEAFIRQAASRQGEVAGYVFRADLSAVGLSNNLLGRGATDAAIGARMRGVRETLVEEAGGMGAEVSGIFTRRHNESDELLIVIYGPPGQMAGAGQRLSAALRAGAPARIRALAEGHVLPDGRTLWEAAESGLHHPESIGGFKFDMAQFSVTRDTPAGFLGDAAREAARGGSAAHGEVAMRTLGISDTSLLFVPDRRIAVIDASAPTPGPLVDLAMSMPSSVRADLERELTAFFSENLGRMRERGLISPGEADALGRIVSTGFVSLENVTELVFRKGMGQLLSDSARARLLNSLLTEEGFNVFVTRVDRAVADYADMAGITVQRVANAPSMQYAIVGMGGAEAAAHQQGLTEAIRDAISAEGARLVPSVQVHDAPAGLLGADAEIYLYTRRIVGTEVSCSAYYAADYAVSLLRGGSDANIRRLMSAIPEESAAVLRAAEDFIRTGRDVNNLHDLYEVDRSLGFLDTFEEFVRVVRDPAVMRELMGIMPQANAERLQRLLQLPF